MDPTAERTRSVIDVEAIAELMALLERRGYQVVGPTIRDGAINYEILHKLEDLPAGWVDEQAPGRYRVKRRADGALFGYTVGVQSWKRFLCPPELILIELQRNGTDFQILQSNDALPRYAFLGVRACELAAIAVEDRVLQGARFTDPHYAGRRRQLFMIAVNCTQAGPNCFCASMGTGPRACAGFDLALTEIMDSSRHLFVVEGGTKWGRKSWKSCTPPQRHPNCAGKPRKPSAKPVDRHGGWRRLVSGNFSMTTSIIPNGTTLQPDACVAPIAPWCAQPVSAQRWMT